MRERVPSDAASTGISARYENAMHFNL